MDLLKLIFNTKAEKPSDYEEVDYDGDVRAIIISQKLEYFMAEQESIANLKGKFKYYY